VKHGGSWDLHEAPPGIGESSILGETRRILQSQHEEDREQDSNNGTANHMRTATGGQRKWLLVLVSSWLAAGVASAGLAKEESWIGTWATSPMAPIYGAPKEFVPEPEAVSGTIRYRIRLSAGGTHVRLRISNELSDAPLVVGQASIALAGEGMSAKPGTLKRVTFGGRDDVALAAGAPALSDDADFKVNALSDVVVSVYIPGSVTHAQNNESLAELVPGNAALHDTFENPKTLKVRPLVSAVLVKSPSPARTIVAFGDSITDGALSTYAVARGWPGVLAQRLAARSKGPVYGIVNAGIGGNRLTQPGAGVAAPARFDRDVLSIPGVSHVIVLEGINDIGSSASAIFGKPSPPVSAGDLISSYQQILARAHEHGIRAYIGTLLPFRGAFYYSDEKEAIRQTVNAWIRRQSEFDGVIDFERAVSDPAEPGRLKPEFDPGDHLHPNDKGYRAMAEAVDLAMFP
jgi:lysophospholipase L1-like esterase